MQSALVNNNVKNIFSLGGHKDAAQPFQADLPHFPEHYDTTLVKVLGSETILFSTFP